MKYLRRFVWFLASRLFVITMVAALMVTALYFGMSTTNISIVLKEGMAKRAQVVMLMEDESELSKYFQNAFLESDALLLSTRMGASPYRDYNVRGIDHRLETDFFWVWPWEERVRVDITERIPRIDGRVKSTRAEEVVLENGSGAVYPPDWQGARYRALLEKSGGAWRIRSLTLLEEIHE